MVRLGKRFYPHLIRTIYADTYLLRTHDVDTVAFMLNDTPQTMYKHYHELRAHDHVRKAYQYTQELLDRRQPRVDDPSKHGRDSAIYTANELTRLCLLRRENETPVRAFSRFWQYFFRILLNGGFQDCGRARHLNIGAPEESP